MDYIMRKLTLAQFVKELALDAVKWTETTGLATMLVPLPCPHLIGRFDAKLLAYIYFVVVTSRVVDPSSYVYGDSNG